MQGIPITGTDDAAVIPVYTTVTALVDLAAKNVIVMAVDPDTGKLSHVANTSTIAQDRSKLFGVVEKACSAGKPARVCLQGIVEVTVRDNTASGTTTIVGEKLTIRETATSAAVQIEKAATGDRLLAINAVEVPHAGTDVQFLYFDGMSNTLA